MAISTPRLLIASLLAATIATTAPTVSFPLNSQLPPVARVSEPFSFIFSPTTFTADSPLSYTLTDPPAWLSVDSAQRRIHGAPGDSDLPAGSVVGLPITLVATDTAGTSTSLSATLVASRKDAPEVLIPAEEQVARFGEPFSQPSSVLAYPERPFEYTFSQDTFSQKGLTYYAVTSDNAPLPAWVRFDAGSLTFSGRTPPFASLIQPPQDFAFRLVASDVVGFAATSLDFSIVVGSHLLTADATVVNINATAGTAVSDKSLVGKIKLDGKAAAPGDIESVATPGIPSWLSFDSNTWDFKGTPTADAQSTVFPLILQDKSTNTLNITVNINMDTAIFRSSLKNVTINAGSRLSFDLKQHLREPEQTDITIETTPTADWVIFDAAAMALSGEVPMMAAASTVKVVVKAKSKTSDQTDERSLNIRILRADVTSSSTRSGTQTRTTAASTASSTSEPTESSSSGTPGTRSDSESSGPPLEIILPAVLILVILILLTLIIIFICRCRRGKRSPSSLTGRDISGPVPGSFVYNGGSVGGGGDSMRNLSKSFDIGEQSQDPEAAGGGKARKSRSKSYLSDTSFYDNKRPEQYTSFEPLPASRGGTASFRDDIKIGIPTLEYNYDDSTQNTPERLYQGNEKGFRPSSSSGTVRRNFFPDVKLVNSSDAGSDSDSMSEPVEPPAAVLPARSESRVGHHTAGPSAADENRAPTEKRTSKLWGKGDTAADFISNLRSKKSRASFTTIDTFDTQPTTGGASDASIINRPRPAGLATRQASSLPFSGAGQDRSLRRTGRLREPTPGPGLITSVGENGQSTPLRDPRAAISYEDIANSSPFKTWATLPSGEETAPDVSTTGTGANWTVLKEESPVINEWVRRDEREAVAGEREQGGRVPTGLGIDMSGGRMASKGADRSWDVELGMTMGRRGREPLMEWQSGSLSPPPVPSRVAKRASRPVVSAEGDRENRVPVGGVGRGSRGSSVGEDDAVYI